MEALWHDAIPFDLAGVQVLQLAPFDTLLHLCLHLTAHGYVHPVGFRDISQLLNHYPRFPWDSFVARARRFRLCSMCYFVLEAVEPASGVSIPENVLAALYPPAWQRWLVRRIADPREILAGRSPYSKPRSYLLHLAVADRPVDVLRVTAWLFFPGPRWLAERYRLQGRLKSWLACLWHPFVVLGQGMLGFWELIKMRR